MLEFTVTNRYSLFYVICDYLFLYKIKQQINLILVYMMKS